MMKEYNRELRRLFGRESREVPQRVKTEVHRRARGKCEWKGCKKKGTEFHHWARDQGTVNTTALLCHKHHRDQKYKTHGYEVKPDLYGNQIPRLIRRKRIPIPKEIRHKTTKTRRRHRKKS